MIKKYITLAALLSAGTALANAAWEDLGDVKITTTFEGTNTASTIAGITPKVTVGGSFGSGVNVGSLSSTSDLINTGNAATNYSSIVPKIDVSAGDVWTLGFTYNLGGLTNQILMKYGLAGIDAKLRIDSIELKLGATETDGDFVNKSQTNSYDFQVGFSTKTGTLTIGQQKNDVTATGQNSLLQGTGPQDNPIVFNFASMETPTQSLTLSNQANFRLTVKGGTGSKAGSIAIQSITLNTSIMKEVQNVTPTPGPDTPEPSAFGLLAGLGALALVASRRRRK